LEIKENAVAPNAQKRENEPTSLPSTSAAACKVFSFRRGAQLKLQVHRVEMVSMLRACLVANGGWISTKTVETQNNRKFREVFD